MEVEKNHISNIMKAIAKAMEVALFLMEMEAEAVYMIR